MIDIAARASPSKLRWGCSGYQFLLAYLLSMHLLQLVLLSYRSGMAVQRRTAVPRVRRISLRHFALPSMAVPNNSSPFRSSTPFRTCSVLLLIPIYSTFSEYSAISPLSVTFNGTLRIILCTERVRITKVSGTEQTTNWTLNRMVAWGWLSPSFL